MNIYTKKHLFFHLISVVIFSQKKGYLSVALNLKK